MMTTYERQQTILRLVQERASVRVAELAEQLDVSEGTVRNDLTALEEAGQLVRVRGGAVARRDAGFTPLFRSRAQVNALAKQKIARWASELVQDGDSIVLDASTTVLHMAQYLQDHQNLTVFTNQIDAARLLARDMTKTVILIGGVLRADGSAVNGILSEELLKGLHVSKAFLSCVGFSLEAGLMEADIQEAALKQAMIRSAGMVIALVDSSKFGKTGLKPFATVDQINHIVTDDEIRPEVVEKLRRSRVTLTVCGQDTVQSLTAFDADTTSYKIGFANLSEEIPFAVDVRRSLETAARRHHMIDLILADNALDVETALQAADNLIAQDIDLMIEYQINESASTLLMDKFHQRAIPVIAIDIPMVGATYFGVDNFRAGYLAGTALGRWLQTHWAGDFDQLLVLEEQRAGALPAARIQGQLHGLQTVVGVIPPERIVYLDSGNTVDVSRQAVATALHSLPGGSRVAIISFNDDAALGAWEATRALGREAEVVIVGQGADRRIRSEIRRGNPCIIGSTAYRPDQYGEKILDLALRILRGEPVPPAVYIEHTFIDAGNINSFYSD
ncbi:MAG: substrate-binding domain-containing protein [Chloroflexi bacterium]|nr:substrate-binding domain-containing protein [Chloroflexota bacterium]